MLSAVAVRQVFIIEIDDGSGRLVAVIEIGMVEVSGCNPTVAEGDYVNKGDELGYFSFGGSSYGLVFDKNFDLSFNKDCFGIDDESKERGTPSFKQKVNSLLCTFK